MSRPESNATSAKNLLLCRDYLHTILASTGDGVIILDASGNERKCNARARKLLGLPDHGGPFGAGLGQVIDQLREQLARNPDVPAARVLQSPGNRHIRLSAHRVADGSAVIIVNDRTRKLAEERRLALAEAEYRSLFENSVYGIYRDSLDGKPIRANPALARFNGYADEQEHIAAVYARPGNWYVNPRRADEFQRILRTEGRVKDLVSEVYRHRTGEKCWITENAWYVYDASGNPMYIEGTIQDATERMRANEEIERLATCDSMTGAANRFKFLRTLAEWTAHQDEPFALFCVDLDRFKEVNDTLGHAAGDFVLQTVSRRLQVIGGDGCVVARLGGDEFAVLKDIRDNPGLAAEMASQIVASLAEPMVSDQFSLEVGGSVGVALCPLHAGSSDELLNSADLALYHVKANGRNGYCIFDSGLKESFRRRKAIERDLRHALANNELTLHYQPIVEAGHRSIDRYEALMRWQHPERGFVSPAEFIPIAEEAGLMPRLGEWAIATACHQAKAFPDSIRVSVNVSAVQLRSVQLVAQVERALRDSGLPPARLELEVTETAIMASFTTAEQVLDRLRQLGVQIALDDFGTGYSSLSYLQRFAFNTVKIDRSFVAGIAEKPANLAVIRAVLSIGRDLGTDIVAEGVETEMQAEALVSEGCRLLQGYAFGKPRSYTDTMTDLALRQLPPALSLLSQPQARVHTSA